MASILSAAPQRLLGKVAVVTGGAKGIGYGCARSLCKEGAKVRAVFDIIGFDFVIARHMRGHLGKFATRAVGVLHGMCNLSKGGDLVS